MNQRKTSQNFIRKRGCNFQVKAHLVQFTRTPKNFIASSVNKFTVIRTSGTLLV